MAYLTASEVRAETLREITGTGEDTLLGTLIARAAAQIARYLGYPAATATGTPSIESSSSYTRYSGESGVWVSDDGMEIHLEPRPVTAVASLYDDEDEVYGTGDLVPSADYSVYEWGIRLKPTGSWGPVSTQYRAVKVSFTAGWAVSPSVLVPVDIVRATCLLVKHYWDIPKRQGASSASSGPSSQSFRDETLPASVRELIDPYRLPSVLA